MVAMWAIFTLMLFVLKPWRCTWCWNAATRDPEGTFALAQRLHWVRLTLSLIALLGAHGALYS